MTPLLSVRGLRVTLSLRDRAITPVDGVDLDIDPGETVALVGESGSGKSVFALSLLRLLPHPPAAITGGTAVFRGQELFSLPAAEGVSSLRFQSGWKFPDLRHHDKAYHLDCSF